MCDISSLEMYGHASDTNTQCPALLLYSLLSVLTSTTSNIIICELSLNRSQDVFGGCHHLYSINRTQAELHKSWSNVPLLCESVQDNDIAYPTAGTSQVFGFCTEWAMFIYMKVDGTFLSRVLYWMYIQMLGGTYSNRRPIQNSSYSPTSDLLLPLPVTATYHFWKVILFHVFQRKNKEFLTGGKFARITKHGGSGVCMVDLSRFRIIPLMSVIHTNIM